MPKLAFSGVFAACVLVAALCGSAAARDVVSGPIQITHAWSPPAPPSAPTAAGYLTLANAGPSPERLIGVSSPDFDSVQVHQMSMRDGVMTMRPVARGLAVPAGGSVTLSPDTVHLMLVGPKHVFKAGDHIPIVLTFERLGSVRAELDVQASATGALPGQEKH